jgi:flagellar protein FliS
MKYPTASSQGNFMFSAYRNPALAYAGVSAETSIAAARPIDLVIMLYDGALQGITKALGHMQDQKFEAKGKAITHVIRIIDEGLLGALDPSGGEITKQLRDLYNYMTRRLLLGSLKNDPAHLQEVRGLLQELKGAWDEISRRPRTGVMPAMPYANA